MRFLINFIFITFLAGFIKEINGSCLRLPEEKALKVVETVLSGVGFSATVNFESYETTNVNISQNYQLRVLDGNGNEIANGDFNGTDSGTFLKSTDVDITIQDSGKMEYTFRLVGPTECSTDENVRTTTATSEIRAIPAWLSLLPPLLTVIVAIATRQVLFALYLGIFLATMFLSDYNPITAFARSLDTKIPNAIADFSHAVILLFSWMLSGMVAIVSKSGGAEGLARNLIERARSSSGALLATYGMGIIIFFDDYANSLIVGNTVRPITDRLRVSREKLSFIVDCTAAPIASIAPISSWIGFEISLIKDEFKNIGLDKSEYIAFLDTIPMRFYPLLLLVFVLANVLLKKDFGPMLHAERRARETGEVARLDKRIDDLEDDLLKPKDGVPLRWYNALVPILAVIATVFFGLIIDGAYAIKDKGDDNYSLKNIFVSADSFHVLMWAGAVALIVPMIMYAIQGIMTPTETLHYWIKGMGELMEPVLILTLAWTLGAVVKELMLSKWMVEGLEGNISTTYLSTVIFLLSALISFCTGSSWSTMTIMFPIVVPLAYRIGNQDYDVLIQNIASVLSGSVFGDHCSPISDTTVLSSLATKCDVSDHVKTQSPYAALVAFIGITLGTLPNGATTDYNPWIGIVVGSIVLVGILFLVGKRVDDYSVEDTDIEEDVARLSVESGKVVDEAKAVPIYSPGSTSYVPINSPGPDGILK